jgi:hypothetical protein
MDPDFERRAEERRGRLRGGVARSFDELEQAGLAFWSEAPYSAKLEATNDAIIEGWLLQGHEAPPRFDGSTWGVLKFER